MNRRKLGNSGLEVSPVALGANVFGWTADEAASFRVLDAFVDAGFNLIDTANTYSVWVPGHQGGESEAIIGKWLRQSGKRDRVLIATKVGMQMGNGRKGLAAAYILEAVEDSLRRLQVDRIDLYQAHQDDASTPLEERRGGRGIGGARVRVTGSYPSPVVTAVRLDPGSYRSLPGPR